MTSATASNVLLLPTAYEPAQCASCKAALHAVYHPHHFRVRLVPDPNGQRRVVIDDSAPFRDRGVIVAGIPVGGVAVFFATTPPARAAVRGTAYGWAKMNGAKMRAKKLCAEHVRIWRVA